VWIDVEEFVVDLYYWFDKSTKRKNELRSYCVFCDQEYRSILKHVSTRWLSLEIAVDRSLRQFPSLKSYFLSEGEAQQRFLRLQRILSDLMTEVNLMFCQTVLPSFTHANMFLQREEPWIHVLQVWLERLVKSILAKFVKPSVISAAGKVNQGCQKRGGWGGPSRPTFMAKFFIIARVHSLLSGATPH